MTDTPNCTITLEEVDEKDTLICTANGNPEDYVYGWEFKSENESDTEKDPLQGDMRNKKSYLTLDIVPQKRIYVCHANNTAGQGSRCELAVEGKQKNVKIYLNLSV